MKTQSLIIEKIRIDGGTQPRTSIETAYVAELSERLDNLPPVDVFFDGTDHWLAEGFHRYHARRKAGKKIIDCIIHKGTQRDAILFSVGANDSHGLRRTNADKRKAVETLLSDKEWGGRSDRWIAEACKVSHGFVGEIRGSTGNVTSSREGKDGKKRELPEPEIDIPIDDEPAPAPTPAKPSKPEPVKDKLGEIIEDGEIVAVFARSNSLEDIAASVSEVKCAIEKGINSGDEVFARVGALTQVSASNLYTKIKSALPYCVCRYCMGRSRGTKDCTRCQGTGWQTKEEYGMVERALKVGGKR